MDKLINACWSIAVADDTTRWTASVSKETDIAVRTFLAQRGMKKGDLSRFIEEAVRWRVFDLTAREAHDAFANMPTEQVEALVDEAIGATRRSASKV